MLKLSFFSSARKEPISTIPVKNSHPYLPACFHPLAQKVDAVFIKLGLKQEKPAPVIILPETFSTKIYKKITVLPHFYQTHPYLTTLTTASFIGLIGIGACFSDRIVDIFMPSPPPLIEDSSLLKWSLGSLTIFSILALGGTGCYTNKRTTSFTQLSAAYLALFKEYLKRLEEPTVNNDTLYDNIQTKFQENIQDGLRRASFKQKYNANLSEQKQFIFYCLFYAVKESVISFESDFPESLPESIIKDYAYPLSNIIDDIIDLDKAAKVGSLSVFFITNQYFYAQAIEASLLKNTWKGSLGVSDPNWGTIKDALLAEFQANLDKVLASRPLVATSDEEKKLVDSLDKQFKDTVETEITKYAKAYQEQDFVYDNLSRKDQNSTRLHWLDRAVTAAITSCKETKGVAQFNNYYKSKKTELSHLS